MSLIISRKLYITISISTLLIVTLPIQNIIRIDSSHLLHAKFLDLRYHSHQSNFARRASCRTFPHNISTGRRCALR
jgi:hypothetical protein